MMQWFVSKGILSSFKVLHPAVINNDATLDKYSRVNWANPGTFDLTPVSTATYGKKGWSKGASNGYLDTGFIPLTHGGSVYAQDDAAIWGHRNESTISAGVFGGCSDAAFAKRSVLIPRFTSNLTYYSVNGSAKNIATNQGNGSYVAKRTGASAFDCFRNNTSFDSASTASTGRSGVSFYWLCENANGTPSLFDAATFSGGGLGSSMTTQKWTDFFTGYVTRLMSIANAITMPAYSAGVDNFTTWKNAVNDYTSLVVQEETVGLMSPVSGSSLTGSVISEGGCLDEYGWAWGAPHTATYIYKINTITGEVQIPITGISATAKKYVGAVYIPETKEIHLCPYNSGTIGIIDVVNNTYSTVSDASLSGTDMWAGWSRGKNGKLYGAPYSATWILVWDPITRTISQLSNCAPGTLAGTAKYVGNTWTGGDEIHFSLHSATAFMYVDTAANTYSTWGSAVSGTTKYTDIGYDPLTGYCYMWPYSNTNVRKIDPVAKSDLGTVTGAAVATEGATRLLTGKWLLHPLDTSRFQIFDPAGNSGAGEIYLLGSALSAGNKFCGAAMGQYGSVIPFDFDYNTVYDCCQRLPVAVNYNYLNHPVMQSF